MSNVASIAMEHQHRCRHSLGLVRCADEEGRELLAIRCGDLKVFVVIDAIVTRLRDLGTSIARNMRWVDKSPGVSRVSFGSNREFGGEVDGDSLLFEIESRAQYDGKAL